MTKPIFGNIAGLGSRRRHHTWFQFAAGSLRCYKRVFPGFILDLLHAFVKNLHSQIPNQSEKNPSKEI